MTAHSRAIDNFRVDAFRVAVLNVMRIKGISRNDLVAVTGMHMEVLKRFLYGRTVPSLGVVVDLADACDLFIDDFRRSRQ